jgi:hypothetical protein
MADELYYGIRERLGEVFCFYFLSFQPPYDFERVKKAVAEFFGKEGVKSYGSYEIFGAVDVVVNAWILSSKVNQIETRLNTFLRTRNCTVSQSEVFRVSHFPYHYLWSDEDADDAPRLDRPAGNTPSKLDEWSVERLNKAEPTELQQHGWLQDIPDRDPNEIIRVFISIPPFQRGLALPLQENLVAEISTVLKKQVPNSILYSGIGTYISLLIEAQIEIHQYPNISTFNTEINRIGLQRFGLKTTTYLTTAQASLNVRTTNVSAFGIDSDGKSVGDYLSLDESDFLEIKGSLSLDIGRLLMTDEIAEKDPLIKEVLGTVVAFLNSRGGELVIGAVEQSKFKGSALEKLKKLFPEYGNGMRLVGVEAEFSFNKEKNWDGYVRRLMDLISTRIGESYGPFITCKRVLAEDGSLCVVQVGPLMGKELAYLDNEFCFVRSGPSTRPLKGQEVIAYLKRR